MWGQRRGVGCSLYKPGTWLHVLCGPERRGARWSREGKEGGAPGLEEAA